MMPSASIVIVTRNRKAVAEQAVRSALAQRGDVEVVVVDDGSTDGTCEYLRERFPDPRLKIHRFDRQEGYIVQRNRGARLATAPILFSIDDDAVINDPGVLPDVLRLFAHPRVGAVMVPFHNCGPDDKDPGRLMTAMAPDDGRVYVTNTFVGTAYAVRRDVFLSWAASGKSCTTGPRRPSSASGCSARGGWSASARGRRSATTPAPSPASTPVG
jgi:glycosyltransferase involved in cell wall biosynthesis